MDLPSGLLVFFVAIFFWGDPNSLQRWINGHFRYEKIGGTVTYKAILWGIDPLRIDLICVLILLIEVPEMASEWRLTQTKIAYALKSVSLQCSRRVLS
jgi:hypothetical protein